MNNHDTIYQAAARGDATAVREFIHADSGLVGAKDPATGWDALTHLCYSEAARDRANSEHFAAAARLLLEAGAPANTGFDKDGMFESALYGAAGVARDAGLTRLLLEFNADPNDDEVPYHAPESYDNAVVVALIDSRRLTADSLATMLLRKCDWHDGYGIALLLKHGADPNYLTRWGYTALHQAIRRDNHLGIIQYLLEHGADPTIVGHGRSALLMAAWHGRGDVLDLCRARNIVVRFDGIDALVAALAVGDEARVKALAANTEVVGHLLQHQAVLLGSFAGIGNTEGLELLLDLGADVNAHVTTEDGYWNLAKQSTALHVASWRARHDTVMLLLARGATVNAEDASGQTPLTLAVRACIDSYWSDDRQPDSVAVLLNAGARVPEALTLPTGYDAIDTLLVPRRASV